MDASSSPFTSAAADPARELLQLVRKAARVLFSIRLGECALIGASAGALTFAAGVSSNVSESSLELRLASGLGAIFAALGWWLERRPDIDSVVRRIDRREGWSGELVTAFESERRNAGRRSPTEIDHALGRRVLAKLSLARCLRAVAPGSVVLLAVPFVSAAVLILAVESARTSSRDSRATADVEGAMVSLAAASDSLRSASDSLRSASTRGVAAGIAAESTRELQALARAAEEARRDLGSGVPSARTAEELLERAARLRASVSADPAGSDVDSDLERAERALRAAREDLSTDSIAADRVHSEFPGNFPTAAASIPPDSRSGLDASSKPLSFGLPESHGASGSSGSSGSPGSGGHADALASASPRSTEPNPTSSSGAARDGRSGAGSSGDRSAISTRDSRARDAGSAPPESRDPVNTPSSTGQAPSTQERGTDGGRWWARRYDAVVERWVETLRDDRTDGSNGHEAGRSIGREAARPGGR